MLPRSTIVPIVLLSLFVFGTVGADLPKEAKPQKPGTSRVESTATLPLPEILRLYKEIDRAEQPEPKPAPVAATINKLQMSGRLLSEAVDITARFEIAVLSEDAWVSVPLLAKDPHTHISGIPAVEGCFFTTKDGHLNFVTRKVGTYTFDLSFLKKAEVSRLKRRVEIGFHDATLAVLRVQFDEGMFRLLDRGAVQEAEGFVLYPEENRFQIHWEQKTASEEVKAPVEDKRPPIESVITSAHASVVSILEGRRITRILYQLRFEGKKDISFVIPEGSSLQKVYLNNAAVPFSQKEGRLHLEVTPARAGDESARLELVLTKDQGEYFLSGNLDFTFPSASWNVNELQVELHLPQVFNYTWSGGSLAPTGASPAVEYSYNLPTPGKVLHFHQQLISSSPNLSVDYTVDLAGNYFRGGD